MSVLVQQLQRLLCFMRFARCLVLQVHLYAFIVCAITHFVAKGLFEAWNMQRQGRLSPCAVSVCSTQVCPSKMQIKSSTKGNANDASGLYSQKNLILPISDNQLDYLSSFFESLSKECHFQFPVHGQACLERLFCQLGAWSHRFKCCSPLAFMAEPLAELGFLELHGDAYVTHKLSGETVHLPTICNSTAEGEYSFKYDDDGFGLVLKGATPLIYIGPHFTIKFYKTNEWWYKQTDGVVEWLSWGFWTVQPLYVSVPFPDRDPWQAKIYKLKEMAPGATCWFLVEDIHIFADFGKDRPASSASISWGKLWSNWASTLGLATELVYKVGIDKSKQDRLPSQCFHDHTVSTTGLCLAALHLACRSRGAHRDEQKQRMGLFLTQVLSSCSSLQGTFEWPLHKSIQQISTPPTAAKHTVQLHLHSISWGTWLALPASETLGILAHKMSKQVKESEISLVDLLVFMAGAGKDFRHLLANLLVLLGSHLDFHLASLPEPATVGEVLKKRKGTTVDEDIADALALGAVDLQPSGAHALTDMADESKRKHEPDESPDTKRMKRSTHPQKDVATVVRFGFSQSFNVARRWNSLLHRYRIACRDVFIHAGTLVVCVDATRVVTETLCGYLGAQTEGQGFVVGCLPPQVLFV
eukprot:6492026-Amphidinium_carterae.3